MFNLNKEVKRLQQLKHTKIHGLPFVRTPKDVEVQHSDGNIYGINAEQESVYIARRFRNYSVGFGRRLSKRKGQYHRPGGGFAGCTIKGR